MKKQFLTARVQGDTVLYYLYSFNGHVSRVYLSGKIGKASEEDKRAGKSAEDFLRSRSRKQKNTPTR